MRTFLAVLLILVFFVFPFFYVIPYIFDDIKKGVEEKKAKVSEKEAKEAETKAKQYIIENSPLLKEIKMLNARYVFFQLNKAYCFDYTLKSKREFDNFDPYEAFCDLCFRKAEEFREIAHRARENKERLEKYDEEFEKITFRYYMDEADKINLSSYSSNTSYSSNSKTDLTRFLAREEERKILSKVRTDLLEENKAKPVVDPFICIRYQYTTPQGQKRYHESKEYSFSAIESAIKRKCNAELINKQYKDAAQRERSLLTAKMRYEVLQRDSFRCCICGASSKDGVQLHVDHIKPVSKGGKTELNNLRTLCSRCNLGKGASYKKNELN